MKNKILTNKKSTVKVAIACAAIGWLCCSAGNLCNAQTQPANPPGLSPDLQEVVRLSQAHMGDDVIKNYIASTGKSYKLSADDIIYLNSQGVSQGVISALQTASAPPQPLAAAPSAPPVTQPPPPSTPLVEGSGPPANNVAESAEDMTQPPAQEVNFDYFHQQLAPYGTWVEVDGSWYWHPDQAIAANPDWRPYYDMGQWVQTDNGLYWQSDYTWGDIPFHYGRWVLDPVRGWLWVPDYTWGPAWVFWRQDEVDGAIGWAPLPVGAVFVDGVFFFHGVRVGLDFDFGLGEACFTFVDYAHFHEGFFRMRGHEWHYHIDHARLHGFYGRSVLRNDFRRDEHGRFVNDGIGRDRISRLTHVEHAGFEERNPVGDRDRLAAQRAEEARRQQVAKPGEQQPGQRIGNPGGERKTPTTSVSKVFRPPTQTPKANTGQQKRSESQQENKKK